MYQESIEESDDILTACRRIRHDIESYKLEIEDINSQFKDELKKFKEEELELSIRINKAILDFIDFQKYFGLLIFIVIPFICLVFVFVVDTIEALLFIKSIPGIILTLLNIIGAIFAGFGFKRTFSVMKELKKEIDNVKNKKT